MNYILSIDQSTSCTKALLFDEIGNLAGRSDVQHRQIINSKGWVEHDPNEIFDNLLKAVEIVIQTKGINSADIVAAAISNQRETSLAWNKTNGIPVYNAIVWQCGRAKDICNEIGKTEAHKTMIKDRTGLTLSPFFSAGKIAWILQNIPEAKGLRANHELICSTIDAWLVYKLTKEHSIKTEYSNASRTQLFNIHTLQWDADICKLFDIELDMLPEVCDSNSIFGHTDFGGILENPIPLCGVLGDSQGALFAQGCLSQGMVKATYGTGSSVMMNIGPEFVASKDLVTSLAWGLNGEVNYVLEGNINYSGATIQWLKNDVKLIDSATETGVLSLQARNSPGLYLVPAFTGLGAPYWNDSARAVIVGMSRTTGKAEIVRAAEEAIAYQIADIIYLMNDTTKIPINTLRVDGGPTNDSFLMQFQADIINTAVRVASVEELSGQGAAFVAGIKINLYNKEALFTKPPKALYIATMDEGERINRYEGWKRAIHFALTY